MTVIRERGSARLLIESGTIDLGRVEPRAMWEDLRTAGVVKDLTRVAVVADQGWIEPLSSVAGAVLPVEVRSFPRDQRDEAVPWLYSRPTCPAATAARPHGRGAAAGHLAGAGRRRSGRGGGLASRSSGRRVR